MLAYYFNLALRSFKRHKILTALMIAAIAMGIGACMTTLTVYYVLSGDPIPHKSDKLFYVQLDPRDRSGIQPGEDPEIQVTRYDAETLLREARADRQAMMTGGGVAVTPTNRQLAPFASGARYTSTDFFPMFEVSMLHGAGWSSKEDQARARVAVVSKTLNERVFGGGNSVGKTLRLDQTDFTVVGVTDDWKLSPRFYDMFAGSSYGDAEDIFVPISTAMELKMGRNGTINCWGNTNGDNTALNAPCVWIQYWVELDSPQKAAAYRDYLVSYSEQQHKTGRFQREPNVALRNVMEWLDYMRVVPNDVIMQMWLGAGFLLVCLLNTVGLLLAKFMRRSGEIGVRRALGASRMEVFKQFLVEAGTIGLAGGIIGLGLSLAGLWAVRQQPVEYAKLAHLDLSMLLVTFVIAIIASLLAGLLPAWRAMQITPAVQLKAQ